MTKEATRVSKRTGMAITFVRDCIAKGTAPKDFDDFIFDVAHVVYNRPGIEGHSIRLKVKDDIWMGIADLRRD